MYKISGNEKEASGQYAISPGDHLVFLFKWDGVLDVLAGDSKIMKDLENRPQIVDKAVRVDLRVKGDGRIPNYITIFVDKYDVYNVVRDGGGVMDMFLCDCPVNNPETEARLKTTVEEAVIQRMNQIPY